MSKELPFFKFNATQWITGNINYETFEVQGAFIRACAEYWNRSNDMTYEDLILRLNVKLVDYLIEKGYIKRKNKNVFIKFLDEEKEDISSKRLKLSESGRKGGLRSAEARLKGGSSIIEEDKEEEKEEDKNAITRKNKQPSLDDVVEYFTLNNYTRESATKAFNYYNVAGWKDSKGKKVLNWKQKMQSVWFKPENEVREVELTNDQILYNNVMRQINERNS